MTTADKYKTSHSKRLQGNTELTTGIAVTCLRLVQLASMTRRATVLGELLSEMYLNPKVRRSAVMPKQFLLHSNSVRIHFAVKLNAQSIVRHLCRAKALLHLFVGFFLWTMFTIIVQTLHGSFFTVPAKVQWNVPAKSIGVIETKRVGRAKPPNIISLIFDGTVFVRKNRGTVAFCIRWRNITVYIVPW